jgi:hypothetical protein
MEEEEQRKEAMGSGAAQALVPLLRLLSLAGMQKQESLSAARARSNCVAR